jgi:hypothetical protein
VLSPRRAVIRALERGALGRMLLSKSASAYFRARSKADVAVFYDGELWLHQTNGWYFPDGAQFEYYADSADNWIGQPAAEIAAVDATWHRLYQPRDGDVVIDVGPGRGEDEISFSRDVGDRGREIAIEANPSSFRLLKKFCQANFLANSRGDCQRAEEDVYFGSYERKLARGHGEFNGWRCRSGRSHSGSDLFRS